MNPSRATVFLTQTPYTPQSWGGDGLARRFRQQYEAGTRRHFTLVDSAREADLIVYCEDYQESEQVFAPKLRAERNVAEFPNRVFTISGEDRPLGFLSGVYVSLPRSRFDDRRFRAGAYFGNINPRIEQAERERADHLPRLLFSFVGARTADVRGALFKAFPTSGQWHVKETGNAQFNIGVDDPAKKEGQESYLRTILESHFVLCPRGYGTASFRLFETMRLGRVPVILADEWVAPFGPSWPECSIRISENQVPHLAEILGSRQAEAAELGARARQEWEAWFSPAVYAGRCLEWIHDLKLSRSQDEATAFQRWPEMIRAAQAEHGGGNRVRRIARRLRSFFPR